VTELAQTDRKVRQHEQMHMAAGGGLITSGPSYEYESGPDGQRYAVAGEVGIDTSRASTPEATVQKAARIRAAALAPADPSAQDRHVAAVASQMQMEALQEIARQQREEHRDNMQEMQQAFADQETGPRSGANPPTNPLNPPGEKANAALHSGGTDNGETGINAYRRMTESQPVTPSGATSSGVTGKLSVYA
jgi:hypothetical protein